MDAMALALNVTHDLVTAIQRMLRMMRPTSYGRKGFRGDATETIFVPQVAISFKRIASSVLIKAVVESTAVADLVIRCGSGLLIRGNCSHHGQSGRNTR